MSGLSVQLVSRLPFVKATDIKAMPFPGIRCNGYNPSRLTVSIAS